MKHFYCLIIYSLFSLSLPCGCTFSAYMTPEQLTQYVLDESNGLTRSNRAGNTKITVTYHPTDLWVHQELGDFERDTSKIAALRKKYEGHLYFVVSFSTDNKEALHQAENFGQYSDLVQTMSFRMPQYATLTTSSMDTIDVADFMMNRTYGMGSSTDVLFVFNKEKTNGQDWVQFNLNEFGLGVGNQRFRFRKEDMEDVPLIYGTE